MGSLSAMPTSCADANHVRMPRLCNVWLSMASYVRHRHKSEPLATEFVLAQQKKDFKALATLQKTFEDTVLKTFAGGKETLTQSGTPNTTTV
jgi:hypothetical protein